MPIVVETGTANPLAVSYITVADADAYHAARGNTEWAALTTTQKEQALVRGAQGIDSIYGFRYSGIRVSQDQGLQWPRKGSTTSDGYAIADDVVPTKVQYANAAAGLIESGSSGSLLPEYTAGIRSKSEQVDVISESTTYASNYTGQQTYAELDGLLNEFLIGGKYTLRALRS